MSTTSTTPTDDASLRNFRRLAHVEGISLLLILFVTMPLKYLMEMPGPNKVIGMVHGLLFLAYLIYALQQYWERDWSLGKLALVWLASVIPFGTFAADRWLLKE